MADGIADVCICLGVGGMGGIIAKELSRQD